LELSLAVNKNDKSYSTRQRQVILEELRKVTSHPSADEIYEMVRKRLPRISLGTVYRNLEQMASEDAILKLDGGTQKRYDGNPEKHYHFRCLKCSEMIDLPFKPMEAIQKMIKSLKNFEITDYRLDFVGICPKCLKAADRHPESIGTEANKNEDNRPTT
jgi:Fur family ferric uptake transcriptional regulator